MAQQTVTALFDDRAEASRAVEALKSAGFSDADIKASPDLDSSTSGYDQGSAYREDRGFWASLGDLFLPEEDRTAYSEGLRRGGVMVSVTAFDGDADRAADILERYGSVDVDERAETWRREGWSDATTAGVGAMGVTDTTAATEGAMADTPEAIARRRAMTERYDTPTPHERSETIPIAEEQLRVGKRVMNSGRVRVRSYVVETPVREDVTLRTERVDVERRPVDRALEAGDDALFRERTIEATEQSEVPVVSKEARVTEEVVVHKDVEERTETVEGTVRKTEVEVDDDRDTSRGGAVPRTGGAT